MERNLNFDEIVDRRNTNCIKYDFAVENHMPEDLLPLWVADMDFKTSSYIEDAIIKRAQNPIFGYSETKEEYFEAVSGWMKKRHGWEPKQEWLIKTPGVVLALAMAVRALTNEGDAVLIQRPVYYPFTKVVVENGRTIVSSDVWLGEDHRYHIDFEDFERKIVDNQVKMFILCNPHNPIARVWTKEELIRLGDICLKHGVLVVSDEIHSDFIFQRKHHVFASLKKEYEDICVVCTAPSKTFNLASMNVSNIFVPNPVLKDKMEKQINAIGATHLGILGLTAAEAAYRDGEEWYQAMMSYVRGNIEFVKEYAENHLPLVDMIEHEGTYLVWLDFRKTGWSAEELNDRIVREAKLWLDDGAMFGEAGKCFQRVNVTCPRSVLKEAMDRIAGILPKNS